MGKGIVLDTYCGEEAVLLCEWNPKIRAFIRWRFEVQPYCYVLTIWWEYSI